jgi:ketosteroid isomerase-like protein
MDYVSRLDEAYKSWDTSKGKDHEKWLELMSDHVVFRSLAGGSPGMEFTKECHSKDDVRGYFDGLYKDWEMIHYSPEQYIAVGENIAVRGTCGFKNRQTKKILQTPKADFFRFENDKIVEFFEFYDTAKAIACTISST